MNKDKIKGELPSFSMLVVKCNVASPMLKHCAWHGKRMMSILWWRWSLNSMWPFSPFVLQILLMLSMLLSVEELESLVIPYCHVFENHLHFLAFVNSVVLQLLLIIIKPWFQSFIILSSPTFILSLSLPHLPQFFYYLQNRTCTETPLQVEFHEIIFPTSHHTHETGSKQDSCAYFTPVMQSVQGWFQTAQRSMFLPYLLVRVFKFDDSWCVGKDISRRFGILTFFHCTSMNTCSNLDGNSDFPLKPCRWLMTLIAIGQELMGTLRHACKTN
jgi:hypothetical protein